MLYYITYTTLHYCYYYPLDYIAIICYFILLLYVMLYFITLSSMHYAIIYDYYYIMFISIVIRVLLLLLLLSLFLLQRGSKPAARRWTRWHVNGSIYTIYIYIYMYVCIYIYILPLSLSIYIYICMYMYTHMFTEVSPISLLTLSLLTLLDSNFPGDPLWT